MEGRKQWRMLTDVNSAFAFENLLMEQNALQNQVFQALLNSV